MAKSPYKSTLNLPATPLPIKVNPQAVEEAGIGLWAKLSGGKSLYESLLARESASRTYILHDGPPYPNGDIHLGHALNKVLKDIILRYKSFTGHKAPYIPGWDCHGLPIESQLIKKLGVAEVRKMTLEGGKVKFREACAVYAMEFVEKQKTQFKQLGVMGDWAHPYLTLQPEVEVRTIDLFGKLAEKGFIFRARKPIHWCIYCETALAEAELEYADHTSPSIYVRFDIKGLPAGLKKLVPNQTRASVVIWTTTPWTLPANVAVALHPDYSYAAMHSGDRVYVIAEKLVDSFAKAVGLKESKVLGLIKGKELEGIRLDHPFAGREVPVVLGDLVTLEQGTGAVHIAPGHGQEDYMIGLKYKLPMIMPVLGNGFYSKNEGSSINSVGMIFGKEFPDNVYLGKKKKEDDGILRADPYIKDQMKQQGVLLNSTDDEIKHSYPHCWRCKNPVIFRATEQWFLKVDHNDLRQKALDSIHKTTWYPSWGESRIKSMVEGRPDWCLSRQRSWGIPIPAFYCTKCNTPHMTGVFNEAIKKIVAEGGTNAYFEKSSAEILPAGTKCTCGHDEFKKEEDILDVWFESGASHYAVLMDEGRGLRWPADLYLEGSDQHRGWFQTSLLTSVGVKDRAPYEAVLTHGFTVDESGKKMSKSLGNVVDPQAVAKQYGADVLRLWVASADFRDDMSASKNIMTHVNEAFSKIRNTCRFLLANLNDFHSGEQAVPTEKLNPLDRYALMQLNRRIARITEAYENFEFHTVFHTLNEYCVNELSAFYLDIAKDRLYCDGKESLSRRSVQTALRHILTSLVRMMAPILAFTAEEIWQVIRQMPHAGELPESVHLLPFPEVYPAVEDNGLFSQWEKRIQLRSEVTRVLEEARALKLIAASLEAHVVLYARADWIAFLSSQETLLADFFMVSQVTILDGDVPPITDAPIGKRLEHIGVVVHPAKGGKCERCWKVLDEVGRHAPYITLCGRCAGVVAAAGVEPAVL